MTVQNAQSIHLSVRVKLLKFDWIFLNIRTTDS